MPATGTWRNLRSLMLLTIQVAAVATVFRYFQTSAPGGTALPALVPLSLAIVILTSIPIGRSILLDSTANRGDNERTCPRCRRADLRPQLNPGAGLFQLVSLYRCSSCWTTVRFVGTTKVIETTASRSEMRFLDEPDPEIRFLDEPNKSDG